MGSAVWKGQALCSGFNTFIGGKEVELDAQVSASSLPDIKGWPATDKDFKTTEDAPSIVTSVPEPEPIQRFVPPANFYAHLAPKPKTKGPLQVFCCLNVASSHL